MESEHLSELTEEEYEAHYIRRQDLKGFLWLDVKYLNPFFTRRLTQEVGHLPPSEAGSGGQGRPTCCVGERQPGRLLPLGSPSQDPICCFSFATGFSASLIIDLLTQFAFPG